MTMYMPRIRRLPAVLAGTISLVLLGGCAEFQAEFKSVGDFFANLSVETPSDETARQAMAESRPDVQITGWYSVNMKVARNALKHKNYSAAARIYRSVHDAMHQRLEPLLGLGDALFGGKSFGEAVGAYRKVLAMRKNNHQARRGLGEALVHSGNIREGVSNLEMALSTGKSSRLFNKLAFAHEMAGAPRTSQAYYRSGLALYPDDLALRNNLALSLALSGDYAEAVDQLGRVAKHPSATGSHRRNLAFVHSMAGNFDAASRIEDGLDATNLGNNSQQRKIHRLAKDGRRDELLAMLNLPALPNMPAAGASMPAGESRIKSAANRRKPYVNVNRKPESMMRDIAELPKKDRIIPVLRSEERSLTTRKPTSLSLTSTNRSVVVLKHRKAVSEPGLVNRNRHGASPSVAGPRLYRVQIAAYRNKATAERGRAMFRQKAPKLLSALQTMVKSVHTAGRIDYRLRTAPSRSHLAAEALCSQLQTKGIQCLVIRHKPTLWNTV